LLPEDWRRVTKTQRSRSFRQQGRGHARDRTRDVRSQRQQTTIVVSETKATLRFPLTHSLLEEIVVIDGWRDDFFVVPTFEDRHGHVFDGAAQARLGADVVPHSGWNSGGHLNLKPKKNPLPAFASVAGFWISLYVFLHDHPATGVVMPVRMMAVIDISNHLLVGLITD
jgi:hypothetical protein